MAGKKESNKGEKRVSDNHRQSEASEPSEELSEVKKQLNDVQAQLTILLDIVKDLCKDTGNRRILVKHGIDVERIYIVKKG